MQYPEEKWDAHLPSITAAPRPLSPMSTAANVASPASSASSSVAPRHHDQARGDPSDDKWAKVEKRPRAFEIDMIRCIYCGLCEEVCPEQAIFLRKDYAITGTSRAEMVHDKTKLYQIGGVRTGLVKQVERIEVME